MSMPTAKTDPASPKPITTLPVSKMISCFQTIVTVEVGAEKKPFLIHKDLLVFYSDYFRGAFNSAFSEAIQGKISLVDERVDVFNIVNKFVYTRQLSDNVDSDLQWEILIRTWIFGDKYLMPSLQNSVMSILLEKGLKQNFVPTGQLKFIYNNTVPGSLLRKMVVDVAAYECSMESLMVRSKGALWSHEALVDLVLVIGAKKKEDIGRFALPEANKGKCYYHIHADGENCNVKL
ncbi:hypothetical protein E4T52_02336 [Aureobasidium sp. EXF-3400]|nr:hypothetical protein E4T52_02336 [Aureobasidium sp. EXF-3400]